MMLQTCHNIRVLGRNKHLLMKLCPERLRLQQEFAEAIAECSTALNDQMLAVMQCKLDLTESDERLAKGDQRRRCAVAAVLNHIRRHECSSDLSDS
jgi:hypothetical protein